MDKQDLIVLFENLAWEFAYAAKALRSGIVEPNQMGEMELSTYWIEAQAAAVKLKESDDKL